MPTIPTWSIRNLSVSRGDQYEDTTGGSVSTTEAVIGTLTPFFGNKADRVRLTASVIAKAQITATTKGSQGGVIIEFRLRKNNVSGTIMSTKSFGISYSAVSPAVFGTVTLVGLDVPYLEAADKTYVVTAKAVLGTNITAAAEWDELTAQATVLSS